MHMTNQLVADPPIIDMEMEYTTYSIVMGVPQYSFRPVMKMPHFKYARVRWLNFRSPLDKFVLFFTFNGLGNKIEQTNASEFPQKYFFSMPIVKDVSVTFNIADEKSYWVKLPEGVNLKTLLFSAWYDCGTEGEPDSTFVTSANPISFAIDFKM